MPSINEEAHRARSLRYYYDNKERVLRNVALWQAAHPLYTLWSTIKQRCYNPNHAKYHLYGALGVRVCDRWRDSYEAFVADMGPRPSLRHSVDRYPDTDGDYEPGNCRWATYEQQRANRRDAGIPAARNSDGTFA